MPSNPRITPGIKMFLVFVPEEIRLVRTSLLRHGLFGFLCASLFVIFEPQAECFCICKKSKLSKLTYMQKECIILHCFCENIVWGGKRSGGIYRIYSK